MNILITGGAGYIGSELLSFLLDEHNVTVYDSLMYEPTSLLRYTTNPNFSFVKGDVRNKEKLKEYIKNTIEDNLNPDIYQEMVLKHIGVLRMYINFGWHRPNSSYSEELSSAIEEVSKSLFPAIKEIYEKMLIAKMTFFHILLLFRHKNSLGPLNPG